VNFQLNCQKGRILTFETWKVCSSWIWNSIIDNDNISWLHVMEIKYKLVFLFYKMSFSISSTIIINCMDQKYNQLYWSKITYRQITKLESKKSISNIFSGLKQFDPTSQASTNTFLIQTSKNKKMELTIHTIVCTRW
jgi:hypothetical protein